MTKSVADRLIGSAQESLAIAKGETPAASITVNGHRYVPAAELDRLRTELQEARANVLSEAIDAVKRAAPADRGGWNVHRAWALRSVPDLERMRDAAIRQLKGERG